MKLVLRTSLLALVAVLIAFAPAHSKGFNLFGKSRKATVKYSIVEEYKEAYRPGGGWFGKKKGTSSRLKHRSAAPRTANRG